MFRINVVSAMFDIQRKKICSEALEESVSELDYYNAEFDG